MYASHASYSACGLGSDGTDRLVALVAAAGAELGSVRREDHRRRQRRNGGDSRRRESSESSSVTSPRATPPRRGGGRGVHRVRARAPRNSALRRVRETISRCHPTELLARLGVQPVILPSPLRHFPFPAHMPSVGSNVPRKDGIGKATGRALYADDLTFPGMLHGRTVRSTIPCGTRARHRARLRHDRLHRSSTIATFPGRNIVALIEHDQPFLVERDVRHMAEPILLLAHENAEALHAARVDIEYDEQTPLFDPERSTGVLKHIDIDKGDVDAALARRRPRRRRDVSHRASGARLHRDERRDRRAGGRRHRRVRLDAVSVLRDQGAQVPARPGHQRARRADGDRRRLRRQGRVSVDDRRTRGAARAQVRPAGEDHLRSRRGHDRDDQAPSVDRAASHGRDARRQARRDGRRRPARRRRVRHA